MLTVPRRYFCCGSLLFLLSVFILWFSYYVGDMFCEFWVAGWPPVWEGAVRSVCRGLSSVCVFGYFAFRFEGRIWDLIVSVPDHCLSFYFGYRVNARK